MVKFHGGGFWWEWWGEMREGMILFYPKAKLVSWETLQSI